MHDVLSHVRRKQLLGHKLPTLLDTSWRHHSHIMPYHSLHETERMLFDIQDSQLKKQLNLYMDYVFFYDVGKINILIWRFVT